MAVSVVGLSELFSRPHYQQKMEFTGGLLTSGKLMLEREEREVTKVKNVYSGY